jgi:N-acetylmuramoyl-L-alanine amidase
MFFSIAYFVFFLVLPFMALASVDVVWVPSYNYNDRLDKTKGTIVTMPTILVLHYTVSDLNGTFEIFQTNGTVSSHYTVAEDGIIYQHVDEKYRAWHAGVGKWGEIKDVNTYSIGIEIVNPGYRTGPLQPPGIKVNGSNLEWYKFKEQQIQSVIDLSADILNRYGIEAENVIAHADLAPGRKEDPGPLFPWPTLAANGVGAWVDQHSLKKPCNESTQVLQVQKKLQMYGYTSVPTSGVLDDDTKNGIIAFQMHFRQSNIAGDIDKETVSILDALLKKYKI